MLPNFLCIGAQKSGTTSIWHILDAHPDVCMARPRETRFFCDAQRFADGTHEYEDRCFRHWTGETAVGEKCPEYLCEPPVAERIRTALGPAVRFVIALRSPAQRAFSHYRHNRAMLRECRSFEAAINEELRTRAHGEAVPAAYAYLERGRYAHQVKRFLSLFGPEQLLVVSFETDIESDQRALAARLYEFLDVAPFNPEGLPFRAGHPPLADVAVHFNDSDSDITRHFVAIQRAAAPRRWSIRRLFGARARFVERVYRPSKILREFAEQFAQTAPTDERLDRPSELDLNRRYFQEDIEWLRTLVTCDTDHWLDARPAREAR